MSMQSDCVYGMGFEVVLSDEQLRDFILKHKNTVESLERGPQILDYINNADDKDWDILAEFENYTNLLNGTEGIYGIIADIIYKETQIPVEYYTGQEDDVDVIMYTARYPWQLSDAEKSLTADTIEGLFNKYIAEFNDPDITYDDDIRREYYG